MKYFLISYNRNTGTVSTSKKEFSSPDAAAAYLKQQRFREVDGIFESPEYLVRVATEEEIERKRRVRRENHNTG